MCTSNAWTTSRTIFISNLHLIRKVNGLLKLKYLISKVDMFLQTSPLPLPKDFYLDIANQNRQVEALHIT